MQRRNVLLPEPEGPIMHMTSFWETSSSIPRNTSSRPKLLCTASALTIGAPYKSSMPPGQQHWLLRQRRRWRVEGDEHPAEALEGRQGQTALSAASEITFQVVLADGQDRRHRQVPDAGDDR